MFVRRSKALWLLLALLLLLPCLTPALELEASVDAGNLGFAPDRDVDKSTLPATTYPWGFRVALGGTVADNLTYDTGIERDPTIRNFAFLQFQHKINTLTLGAGPTVGFLSSPDSPRMIRPGLAASIRWNLFAVAYLSLDAVTPLYSPPDDEDDYFQARRRVEMGFYLPNIIATLSVAKKEFILSTEEGEERDELLEYAAEAEVFQKNIPYRITVRFAYQDYRKFFEEGTDTTRHALGALIFGTGFDYEFSSGARYYIDLDSSVYTFGRLYLLGEFSESAYFFRARTGFAIDLASITLPTPDKLND